MSMASLGYFAFILAWSWMADFDAAAASSKSLVRLGRREAGGVVLLSGLIVARDHGRRADRRILSRSETIHFVAEGFRTRNSRAKHRTERKGRHEEDDCVVRCRDVVDGGTGRRVGGQEGGGVVGG